MMVTPKTITSHGVPARIQGRGPNGRRFCRWCHAEVPKGRSSYCNDECAYHSDFNRSKLVAVNRDGRRCMQCGVAGRYRGYPSRSVFAEKVVNLEVDHIQSVKDGGSHHPNNLRTLCHACHIQRTKEQRAERRRLALAEHENKIGGGEEKS